MMAALSFIGQSTTDSVPLTLSNPGFESGLAGWISREDKTLMSIVTPEAARTGRFGLRVTDESGTAGADLATRQMPVEPGRAYCFSVYARVVSGSGVAAYLRFFDAKGRHLNPWPQATDLAHIQSPDWREYTVTAVPPEGAKVMDAWIHSYNGAKVVADFDDVSMTSFPPRIEPPWTPAYKISPTDTARLTPSDVVGPDGLVYPNWKNTGMPGGIPEKSAIPVVVGPEAFAAYVGRDVAPFLNEILRRVAAQGGGVIELPAGTFLLDSPVVIRDSGIVIRGAGRNRTRFIYQDHIPFGSFRLYCWNPNGKVGPDSFWEIQTNPKNLVHLRVTSTVAGRTIVLLENVRRDHWGNRFMARLRGRRILEHLGPGRHQVEIEAGYSTGETFGKNFEIEVLAQSQPGDTWVEEHGAFVIAGSGLHESRIRLSATARRGGREIRLESGHGFKPGDRIMIEAPPTEHWRKTTGNTSPWGPFRINHYEITAVTGSVVTISEPLRLEFSLEDDAYVQRIGTVSRSGLEGFTVEQKVFTPSSEFTGPRIPETLWWPMEDLWTDGVTFTYAWQCWLRDVRVVNAGRNPIYTVRSKQCEIRDVEADGAIFKGGGGTGYVGFEYSFDCLMDGVRTRNMRHAPNVQWGAAGNVIRNGHFTGSDAQWHAGWTNENLYENNVIEQTAADSENGAYGHGFFASGPASVVHGPQGPRNVIYNNDVSAPRDGLHMVGGNEAWLILHNRFRLGQGRAVYGGEKSFDHVIRGNVFIIEKPAAVAVLFGAANCTGIEVVDNQFYGPVGAVAGFSGNMGCFEKVSKNKLLPAPSSGNNPPRPQPAVPSIFEWQRRHAP